MCKPRLMIDGQWSLMQRKLAFDYQCEIQALRIDEEDLGTQVTVARVPTWAHLQFCAKLQQLIAEAGLSKTVGLVYQVWENLPTVIKELTTPGLADWVKFLDKIKGIDRTSCEKSQR